MANNKPYRILVHKSNGTTDQFWVNPSRNPDYLWEVETGTGLLFFSSKEEVKNHFQRVNQDAINKGTIEIEQK